MKRRDLIAHLERHGCLFVREGGDHTIYRNPANKRQTAVPRHREVREVTARKICRDLGLPEP